MKVRDFLASVVPWGHHVVVNWHHAKWKGHFRSRSCRTPDEVLQAARQLALQNDFYFCLTSQQEGGGKREADNAVAARSLFIDVDVGPKKFYKTVEDAMEALLVFCKKTGMPKPSAVVLSGGGLHAYWFSDRDLPISDWKPYAEGLKIAAATYGFKIDPTVTADAARILRLPGTLNHKYGAPRVVELVEGSSGQWFDFSHTFKMMKLGPLVGKRTREGGTDARHSERSEESSSSRQRQLVAGAGSWRW